MKTIATFLLITFFATSLFAQKDTTVVKQEFNQLIENVKADNDTVKVSTDVKADADVKKQAESDTLKVRVGNANVKIVTGEKKAHIDVETMDDDYKSKWDKYDWERDHPIHTVKIHHKSKFDGHWAGIDFGGNQLWNTNYDLYPDRPADFLETRPEKSFEFNLNFAEYSFGFGSYVGIVTGLGFNWNDYKFKNRYTLTKDENGMIQPVDLPEGDFRKSKLSSVYLTAPLMLEIQIPGNHKQDRLFIAGGVIGGIKLGEHTKTKIGDEKSKDKGDFNLSPLRWGYTARIGFEDMGIFATYYNTPLFQDGKGPETTPLTIGLTFTF